MTSYPEDYKKLFIAVDNNDVNLAKEMISKGVSPNIENESGQTIMDLMIKRDRAQMMMRGNDLKESEDVITYLIDAGLDVNYVEAFSRTLIHKAIELDLISMVKLLIKKNALKTARLGPYTETPLIFHAESMNMLNFLLEEGYGNLKSINESGSTLLLHQIKHNNDYELIRYLIKNNDVNASNQFNETPLTEIINQGKHQKIRIEFVELLIKQGADINKPGRNGKTALIIELSNKQADIDLLTKLITLGSNINSLSDDDGRYPIHYATVNAIKYIELLLDAGADINMFTDTANLTPLMVAAIYGFEGNLNYLIEKGADLDIKSTESKTALNYAVENNEHNIISILKKHNAIASNINKQL